MVAITGVCSGRERREGMQSLSTRDPNVEEIIFICVLWGTLYLWKVYALMASDTTALKQSWQKQLQYCQSNPPMIGVVVLVPAGVLVRPGTCSSLQSPTMCTRRQTQVAMYTVCRGRIHTSVIHCCNGLITPRTKARCLVAEVLYSFMQRWVTSSYGSEPDMLYIWRSSEKEL